MPVIDPATGEQVATAASGSAADVDRAVQAARAAFDDGRWRFLAPLEQERRLRKLAALLAEHADELADLDVIDSGLLRMYAGFIAAVRDRRARLLLGLADQAARHHPGRSRDDFVVSPGPRAGRRRRRLIVPWNGPTAAARSALFRTLRRQQRRAQAGRADADDRSRGRASSRSKRASRRASFNVVQGTARPSAPRSSRIPRST